MITKDSILGLLRNLRQPTVLVSLMGPDKSFNVSFTSLPRNWTSVTMQDR